MPENPEDYGWFIRLAKHPMSIRTLDRVKLAVNFSDVVFHKKQYLGRMPGFQYMPHFNQNDPKYKEFIKVPPPAGLQITAMQVGSYEKSDEDVEFHEIDLHNFGDQVPVEDYEEDYDDEIEDDDVEEVVEKTDVEKIQEVLDDAPDELQPLIGEVDGQSEEGAEEVEEKPAEVAEEAKTEVNIKELELIKEEFKDFDNKKWVILKKEDIETYLNRLGVEHDFTSKWDMLKLFKGIIQG